ncbi:hypothetical protein GCM10023108_06340 [Saccharopolyspora hordei]
MLEAVRQLLHALPERERVRFTGQGRELGAQVEAHRARRGPRTPGTGPGRRRITERAARGRLRVAPAPACLLRVEARRPRRGRRILR